MQKDNIRLKKRHTNNIRSWFFNPFKFIKIVKKCNSSCDFKLLAKRSLRMTIKNLALNYVLCTRKSVYFITTYNLYEAFAIPIYIFIWLENTSEDNYLKP